MATIKKSKKLFNEKELVPCEIVETDEPEQQRYRVKIYGHTYEWYTEKEPRFEQVLTRDGLEICRTSGFDSGLPCSFAWNFNEIAGTQERSYTVAASLMGAKGWPK